ncbi:hypothetical protein LP52_20580 [Streptomonospora alba]|uniref:Pyrrolo-quinoline quinone n=1 Tax=Streptomonospora alba TaxID=183763 RepID=A0A0C2J6T2_9ACTN|nr:hypothetical protein [Streptomonospora alba]KIH97121.1 hypothetical protein LP52_20580 [Streptomonospora alba]
MRTWRRAPLAAAAGVALLVAGSACTPEDEPDGSQDSPRPLPTAFESELPPGVGGEPLRHLHGPGGEGPDILDDEMGVRISAVGDAFLVSSNSEERHLLLGAEDGRTLWRGRQHIQRFGLDADGSQVLIAEGRDGGTEVIGDDGETVWHGTGGRTSFVGGVVVRRPADWSAGEPYGDYTVRAPGGAKLWEYTFEAPPEDAGEPDGSGSEGSGNGAADDGGDPDRNGVPVAARDGVLLLDDGQGLLQARGIGEEGAGELLWSIAGDDPALAGGTDVQRPRPQVIGSYEIPSGDEGGETAAPEEGTGAPQEDRSASPEPGTDDSPSSAAPSPEGTAAPSGGEGPGDEPARTATLVRWTVPEEPSVLSLHDLHSGELLWSVAEPGANPPGDEFAPPPLQGALYERDTGTVLLPQATGETPLIAVGLEAGEIRWEFEDEFEQAISPALAMNGYIYGDARGTGDTSGAQVVLDADDKNVAAEGLGAYVEAATAEGYSIVVSDRQRFVFPPADAPEGEETSPTG